MFFFNKGILYWTEQSFPAIAAQFFKLDIFFAAAELLEVFIFSALGKFFKSHSLHCKKDCS
jgi:hypothetical protein